MQLVRVPTSAGVVHFHAGELRGDRPLIVMLQGADQLLAVAQPFCAQLSDCDLILACLPGHNGAPALSSVAVDLFAEAYSEALDRALKGRPFLFVGESLGGVIGMAMGCRPPDGLARVIAIDPFLDGDIWPLQWLVSRGYVPSVAATFAGSYSHLLDGQKRPLHVVAGDQLLGPEEVDPIPSLLRAEDRKLVDAKAKLSIIHGGHTLLRDRPGEVASIVRTEASAIWSARKRPPRTRRLGRP